MLKRVICLLFICFISATIMAVAQPKIQSVQGTMLDLGEYYEGQKAERIVTIRNAGSDTLRISDVKATCGCTATLMSNRTLAPSAQGDLSITFNTTNYSGKVTKEVFVSSNDPSTPKLTIQFTASVMKLLNLVPGTFVFDNSVVDSTYTKTIVITNPSSKEPVKILGVDTKFDQIKVTLMKNELAPGEQTQLQAVFHPIRPGTYNGVVELTTDSPRQPKFDVKFFCWVNRK